ncbi:MAG TPA: phosphoglycerate dehydrogenase [Conexibacter sp.]|nr:phosphoglycerate dehydrogenase [Conexibacter sp.]
MELNGAKRDNAGLDGQPHGHGHGHGHGRVLVTAPGFDLDGEQTGLRLQRRGLQVDHAGPSGSRSPDDVARLAAPALAAIASADPFTAEVFEAAPQLRVIARLGVGFDSVDLDAATRAGVVVTTTPGLNDETCADHALALTLAVMRRVVEHDASVRRGEWDRGGALTPWDLHRKRVGVVGYGRIGRGVVRRLQGFGTEIRVFDPVAEIEPQLAAATLAELLGWADVVTLHAPLTPATQGLIGPASLALMKPGAILVNASRGGLVDEAALVEALTSGRLRAAALDVFADEPPTDTALTRLPNVVLSPHIGGLSREAIDAMASRCVQQVIDVLDGRVPDGVVNPAVLAGR